MNKIFCGFFGSALILAFLVIGYAGAVQAEVNVNINIGPPPIVVTAPPAVVMMPQYGIYFVPGISFDVFFYNGYWWSPRGDRWYRASEYNGPWGVIQRNYVPGQFFKMPKNYREVYKNEHPINYGQWKKQYKNQNVNKAERSINNGPQGKQSQNNENHGR